MRHRASSPWAPEPATSTSADSNRAVGARPLRASVQRRAAAAAPATSASRDATDATDVADPSEAPTAAAPGASLDDPFALHLTAAERRREASLDEPSAIDPRVDVSPDGDDSDHDGDHDGDHDDGDRDLPDGDDGDDATDDADAEPAARARSADGAPDLPDGEPASAPSAARAGAPVETPTATGPSAPAPATTAARAPVQRKPGRRYSPGDRYNRDVVHSQPKRNAQQVNRPGVRIGGRDLWKVVGGTALRYRITSGRRTEVFDQVNNQMRICLNVGYRNLLIDGAATPCVFVWADGRGSAWLPVRSLEGGDARTLRTAVRKQASWTPAQVPSGSRFERYRFGDGGRAQATAYEDGRHAYINHAQKADANKLEHYLKRTAADGLGGQHSYFTVSMNLPQADAPPVAFETAVPGEAFFVPKGATFRRRVGVFEHAAMDPGRHEIWVYGYLGKDGAGGKRVPDAARRGWVPLRVLVRG